LPVIRTGVFITGKGTRPSRPPGKAVRVPPNRGARCARFCPRALLLALLLFPLGVAAGEETLSDEKILGPAPGMKVESSRLRLSYYDQDGHGYQSQAGRSTAAAKGSEMLLVEQPQLELVATQGKFTHRFWVPVDIVTAASADAIDAMSSASRKNEAASVDITTTYHASPTLDGSLRAAVHMEEPFRSFQLGTGGRYAFAEENAVLSGSLNQAVDEFDQFDFHGTRMGRVYRSTSNANLGLSQLLSATTVAYAGYGATVQVGELSNTWNAVPLSSGKLGRERLPKRRYRHAGVVRLMQALPWMASLHGSYRLYADSWKTLAHTLESSLFQRLSRAVYLRLTYRFHTQSAPSFWTAAAPPMAVYRSADSDLAELRAHTLGGGTAFDLGRVGGVQNLHIDLGYDRYFRSNDLRVNVYTCGVGFGF
jgi:hypothetical protein